MRHTRPHLLRLAVVQRVEPDCRNARARVGRRVARFFQHPFVRRSGRRFHPRPRQQARVRGLDRGPHVRERRRQPVAQRRAGIELLLHHPHEARLPLPPRRLNADRERRLRRLVQDRCGDGLRVQAVAEAVIDRPGVARDDRVDGELARFGLGGLCALRDFFLGGQIQRLSPTRGDGTREVLENPDEQIEAKARGIDADFGEIGNDRFVVGEERSGQVPRADLHRLPRLRERDDVPRTIEEPIHNLHLFARDRQLVEQRRIQRHEVAELQDFEDVGVAVRVQSPRRDKPLEHEFQLVPPLSVPQE